MPDWICSGVGIKGSKEALHKLIKIGLENSSLQSTDDLQHDFDLLVNEGKHLVFDEQSNSVKLEKGLTARTFLPMPETFLLYDTTNYPEQYPDAVKEQQEKYGVVGWYDYNRQTLGTKWDFDLTEVSLDNMPADLPEDTTGTSDIWDFFMETETAWNYPDEWMIRIKEMVPELDVSIEVHYGFFNDDDDESVDNDDVIPDISGYIEDGVFKEGLSPMTIEWWRLTFQNSWYPCAYPDAQSVVSVPVIGEEANSKHPVIKEMKAKGYRLVEHNPIGNEWKKYAMILTFIKE